MRRVKGQLDRYCPRSHVHHHASGLPRGLHEMVAICVYCEQPIYRLSLKSSQWGTMPEYDFLMADPHLEVPIA